MKSLIPVTLASVLLASLAGCAHDDPTAHEIPSATVNDAVFPPGSLDTIKITGEYFKPTSTNKMDVAVSVNGRNWLPAKKIIESSPSKYVAVLPYGVNFPMIWVRVYGVNKIYSAPVLAHVSGGAGARY